APADDCGAVKGGLFAERAHESRERDVNGERRSSATEAHAERLQQTREPPGDHHERRERAGDAPETDADARVVQRAAERARLRAERDVAEPARGVVRAERGEARR